MLRLAMSVQKLRFVGLTVWSPIGNRQTDRRYFIDIDIEIEIAL